MVVRIAIGSTPAGSGLTISRPGKDAITGTDADMLVSHNVRRLEILDRFEIEVPQYVVPWSTYGYIPTLYKLVTHSNYGYTPIRRIECLSAPVGYTLSIPKYAIYDGVYDSGPGSFALQLTSYTSGYSSVTYPFSLLVTVFNHQDASSNPSDPYHRVYL